ncbi:MAG: tRNA pseudouridine(13) synthase TruD, partial [Rhodospirillales bacterium]|nr:tRNA pseudouridine(13) synthase TruD [Rhodospirillales bacterium]
MDSLTAQLSYLTSDLPGIGGTLKARPEDFLVEEQPASELTGDGEHLYLFIEKRRRTTIDVVRRLAKAFGVSRGEIGYAGLKDKHAITRQQFSIRLPDRSIDEKGLAKLQHHPQLTVLWAQRHEVKLRRGHHGGNRFVIRLRDVQATDAIKAKPVLERLATSGVPNFIGEQRFG